MKTKPRKVPRQVGDAWFYINSQVVRGTLDEADPKVIEARRIIAENQQQSS